MRIVNISGLPGSGKSTALHQLAQVAGRPVISGTELEFLFNMVKRGSSQITLETETFVDEVTPRQRKMINKFAEENSAKYGNDYLMVIVHE